MSVSKGTCKDFFAAWINKFGIKQKIKTNRFVVEGKTRINNNSVYLVRIRAKNRVQGIIVSRGEYNHLEKKNVR